MRILPTLLVFLIAGVSMAAEPVLLIGNVGARKTTSLDGAWNTIVDPYENGYYDFHMHPHSDGYFKNAKPQNPNDLIEYDFDKSPVLRVPGDWNTQRESLFFYEGTIWYKRSFDYEKKPGTRVFLHFGAANYQAIVYVNGSKAGEHIGGFTPFDFEVGALLHDGSNFVVVKVDNKRHPEAVPTINTDWWNYGGLTRSVQLIELPETFIQDAVVQLTKGSQTEITATVRMRGPKASQTVNIEIPEAKLRATVKTDASGTGTVSFKAPKLDLWSPEHPKLYDVRIVGETDSMSDRIGFRTIEVKGEDILLNGHPIFLRGISMHEEAPFRGGRGLSIEESRTLLGWIKDLGGNFVRLAHYPHDEMTTREADRLGLLVWSEVPVYWTVQFTNPASYDNARNQLEENITRDRNRASIIIWSVANETPLEEARTKFLSRLADEVRRLDSTRLVSAALLVKRTGDTIAVDDPLSASLDVIGCNEYIGWYVDTPETADTLNWSSSYGKPLVISEFGADARYGRHGDASERFTEEYQERLYKHQVGMLKRISFLRGMSPWILMDFRSPRRSLPEVQEFWNRKGLFSERGERKKAFYVLQKFYEEMKAKYQALAAK